MPDVAWDVVGRWAVPPLVAVAADALLGDPPGRWHPVAWMGSLIVFGRRHTSENGRVRPFLGGVMIVAAGVTLSAAIGLLVTAACHSLPPPLGWIVEGVALKLTVAARGLSTAAGDVRAALERDDLPEARRLLSWHLVSRDTAALTAAQTAAATVESVAENTSDGVVAPLFWFAVGGLPAALAYRFVNTADAMLGYRDAEREWLGKPAARLDDLLNLVPARLTAALFLLLGCGGVRVWWRDCRTMASPNAGHPMAAAAGVLGVELEKVGAYVLGRGLRQPGVTDIKRMTRLLWAATAAAAGLCVLAAIVRGVLS